MKKLYYSPMLNVNMASAIDILAVSSDDNIGSWKDEWDYISGRRS